MNLKIYILFVSLVITVSIFFLFTSANSQNNANQKTISLCKAVASIPTKAGFPTSIQYPHKSGISNRHLATVPA